MAQITKSFSKDMDEMEGKLSQLNKNRYSLKMDLREAQKSCPMRKNSSRKQKRQRMSWRGTTLRPTLTGFSATWPW